MACTINQRLSKHIKKGDNTSLRCHFITNQLHCVHIGGMQGREGEGVSIEDWYWDCTIKSTFLGLYHIARNTVLARSKFDG